MSSEVAIYLQKIKRYFQNNNDAIVYFLKDVDEDFFFNHLTEIAEKNFEELGDPSLTPIQFELLREKTHEVSKVKIKPNFLDIGDFGKYYLN